MRARAIGARGDARRAPVIQALDRIVEVVGAHFGVKPGDLAQIIPTPRKPTRSLAAPPASPSAFAMPDEAIERALRSGESRGMFEDYFGPAQYTELRDLARDAATRSARGGPGADPARHHGLDAGPARAALDNVLWLDPAEIALGRLTELRLKGATAYHAVGVILLAYLKLQLRLRIAGFDATFHPFDWRLGLDVLGDRLADAVASDAAGQVSIVAHSMGGLVARAALPRINAKLKQLIMLGTPNYGSFAPVQVSAPPTMSC